MIVAYCDRCGEQIEPEFSSGCRIVLGKSEYSWHLCPKHMGEAHTLIKEFLTAHEWRVVR